MGPMNEKDSDLNGSPVFKLTAGSLSQRFVLSLRYYQSAMKKYKDGIYEFAADPQESFEYSELYQQGV